MKRQRINRRGRGPSVACYHGRRSRGQGRLLAAAVCLGLGLILVTVRLWGMRFSGFLLWAAAGALALSAFLHRLAADGGAWELLRRVFYGLLAVGLTVLCVIEGFVIQRGSRDRTALPADAVIVLGAGVNGTVPSLSLRTRLDAALAYAKEHPDAPIVLTGGKGYGEDITEARCMYRWLTERGVAEERLILEERAVNTAENFAFSREALAERGMDVSAALVAVVTNDFHIARAELIAQKQGFGGVIGVPAKLPWRHLAVNYYLREAFAVVKAAVFD